MNEGIDLSFPESIQREIDRYNNAIEVTQRRISDLKADIDKKTSMRIDAIHLNNQHEEKKEELQEVWLKDFESQIFKKEFILQGVAAVLSPDSEVDDSRPDLDFTVAHSTEALQIELNSVAATCRGIINLKKDNSLQQSKWLINKIYKAFNVPYESHTPVAEFKTEKFTDPNQGTYENATIYGLLLPELITLVPVENQSGQTNS